MVGFITNKEKFLFVPRKKRLFVLWNSLFSFFLERKYVQESKYVMVAGGYSSHIDCRDIVHGTTIEFKSRPKRSNGTVHRQVNLL